MTVVLDNVSAEGLHPPCRNGAYVRACLAFALCAELRDVAAATRDVPALPLPPVTAMVIHHAVDADAPCPSCAAAPLSSREPRSPHAAVVTAAAASWHLECLRATLFRMRADAAAAHAKTALTAALLQLQRPPQRKVVVARSGAWIGYGEATALPIVRLLLKAGASAVHAVLDVPGGVDWVRSHDARVAALLCSDGKVAALDRHSGRRD